MRVSIVHILGGTSSVGMESWECEWMLGECGTTLVLLRLQLYLFIFHMCRSMDLTRGLLIRAVLVRSDPEFRHHPIKRICEKHKNENQPDYGPHVIQAVGFSASYKYENDQVRPALSYLINHRTALDPTMRLCFACSDCCHTGDTLTGLLPEVRARDVVLCLTLESWRESKILARRVIKVIVIII